MIRRILVSLTLITLAASFSATAQVEGSADVQCLSRLSLGLSQLNNEPLDDIPVFFSQLSREIQTGNRWLETYLNGLGLKNESKVNSCEEIHKLRQAKASIEARKVLLEYAYYYSQGTRLPRFEAILKIKNLPQKMVCLIEQLVYYRRFKMNMASNCELSFDEFNTISSANFISDRLERFIGPCSYPLSESVKQEIVHLQLRKLREAQEFIDVFTAEQNFFYKKNPDLKNSLSQLEQSYAAISPAEIICEDPKQQLFDQIHLSTKAIEGAARSTFSVAHGTGFLTQGNAEDEIYFVTAFHSVNPTANKSDRKKSVLVIDFLNPIDRFDVEVKPYSPSALNDIVAIPVNGSRTPLLPLIDSWARPSRNQIFYVAGYPIMYQGEFRVFECFFMGYETKVPYHLDEGSVQKYKMFCPTRINLEGASGGPVFDEDGVVWGVDSAQDFVEGSILVSPISRNDKGQLIFGVK